MIGILDSGLGGLSVLKEVVRLLPTQEILYYADTAHCPYGGRSQGEICDLTHLAVERLVGLGAELVVLACNTMTGASVVSLREYYGDRVSIVGMVPALKPALALTRSGVVGVLATRATLVGGGYSLVRERFVRGEVVLDIAGDGLVEIVERGEIGGQRCGDLLRGYLSSFVARGGDVLVLGCTHYPFLTGRIREILGDGITILNPAPSVAEQVVRILDLRGGGFGDGGVGSVEFLCSGSLAERARLEGVWGEIINNKI